MGAWGIAVSLVLGLAAHHVVAEQYPTTYPYENEKDAGSLPSVEDLPDATPSKKPDDANDPGGYFKLFDKCTLWNTISADKPFSPLMCEGAEFALNYEVGSMTWGKAATDKFNCTKACFASGSDDGKTMTPITQKPYGFDVMDKVMVDNEPGWCPSKTNCCPHHADFLEKMQGNGCYRQFDTNTLNNRFKAMGSYYKPLGCPEHTTISNWCHQSYKTTQLCTNQYLSPSKRVTIYACPDTYWLYFSQCPVLMAKPGSSDYFEPLPYISKLSGAQFIKLRALHNHIDKVCHPYSYYYPSMGKTPASSSAASSSVSAASSSVAAASSTTPPSTSESTSSAMREFTIFATAAISLLVVFY